MRRQRQGMAGAVLVALLLSVAGCTATKEFFTGVTPETVEEGVAASYVTLTTANETFTGLVNGGAFSQPDAQRISEALDAAGSYLRSAKQLLAENRLEDAEDYLRLSQDVLRLISRELDAKS